jgi:hypothetical protein
MMNRQGTIDVPIMEKAQGKTTMMMVTKKESHQLPIIKFLKILEFTL